ncbi:hypothetical protein JCM24511_08296 [Saitozyma sp. JCM 24511]|nr:hypothetical protein JCM24511_08296 [Saitozyma sp. JCM 24511]
MFTPPIPVPVFDAKVGPAGTGGTGGTNDILPTPTFLPAETGLGTRVISNPSPSPSFHFPAASLPSFETLVPGFVVRVDPEEGEEHEEGEEY